MSDVLFVTGAMRSGTTVLQHLACSAPQSGPFTHEVRWLAHQLEGFSAQLDADDPSTRDHFGGPAGLEMFTAGVVRQFVEQARKRAGNPACLVLKGSDLTPHAPRLARWLPTSRFVVAVREPKDVIASMLEVAVRQEKAHVDTPLARIGASVAELCAFLEASYAPLLAEVDGFADRVLFVRYEDLVREPHIEAPRIAAFAGLTLDDFDPDAAWSEGYDMALRTRDPRLASLITEVSGQGVRASRIGRWQKVLTPDQAALVDQRCAALRSRFGYLSW